MLAWRSHSFTCRHAQTIPAFTPQPQSITALWLVLIRPTHRGMARLSWPGWLVIYRATCPELTPNTVTCPSTNRACPRVTWLSETNLLPLSQTATYLAHSPLPVVSYVSQVDCPPFKLSLLLRGSTQLTYPGFFLQHLLETVAHWNWNKIISAAERVLKLFQNYFGNIKHVGKYSQVAVILWNNFGQVSVHWNKILSDGRRRTLK